MRPVRRFRCLDGLRQLVAPLGSTSSTRGNLAIIIMAILSSLTVAAAVLLNQPEPSKLVQNLPQQSAPLPSIAEPTANSLALPLTKITVESAPPTIIVRKVIITLGDTLMSVMTLNGSNRPTAHAAITALSKFYDPRRVQPGQKLTLWFDPKKPRIEGHHALIQMNFAPSAEKIIQVRLNNNGSFKSKIINKLLAVRLHRAEGAIDDSLYLSAKRAGVPVPVIVDLIRVYSFDVDFQRDIQRGDYFEVLFEAFYDERGKFARYGVIKYAKLYVRKTDFPLYRFVMQNGKPDYFNLDGHSVRKALMKTPIDGARLTSRFGRRKHPILGYKKMHRGIDFGAPRGTPVMAAGNGTVEVAGWNGNYGRYLRIRHNGRYKTAYGHLSKFHRGVRKGKRVLQGQIVAFVGSSGQSTGPHLHYEILVNNKRINPLRLNLPSGKKLKGMELAQFKKARDETKRTYADSPVITRMAQSR